MKAGWQQTTLGDVANVGAGNSAPQGKESFEGGEFPFFRTSDVGKVRFGTISQSADLLNDVGAQKLREVPAGTVLMPKSGASTFLNHRVQMKVNGFVSSHLATIKAFEGIASDEFLLYYLATVAAQDLIQDNKYPSLTLGQIKSISIDLPALDEQQRIVAVLDEAFAALDRARTHAETNLKNARELFESYLASIFSDQASDWTSRSFGNESFIKIVDGDRGANYPKKADFLSDGHCLFLNTKNVRPDGFNFDTKMFITEEKDKALRKGKLERRDVVLTTRGTIGNIALYDDSVEFEDIRINSGMLILRPNEEIIASEYLFELLRSHIVKAQIDDLVSGAAQPQLPIKSLVKFEVPVPNSLTEQTEIVGKLNELSEECVSLANSYTTKLSDLEDLRQSLLQRAFAGELT